MKKLFALLLCAALLMATLAGCGGKTEDGQETAAEDVQQQTAAAPEEEPIVEQPLVTDPDAGIAIGLGGTGYKTYTPDAVVGTVDGVEVTWQEYYYWLTYYASMLFDGAIENGVELTSWDAVGEISNDMSNAEVIITAAQYMTTYYHAILNGAEGIGAELSEQDLADIESIYISNADLDGDGSLSEEEEASYDRFLAEKCVDSDFYRYLLKVAKITEVIFNTLYGEDGGKYSEEDTKAFIDENGYMSAKRIAILTIDRSTGLSLDEETVAEKTALAEQLHDELAAAASTDELIALFDEYMYEYSDDTGAAEWPDGYVFTDDGSPLTTITAALDENYGLSDVEETSYGYEIVLRQPVQPDMAAELDTDGSPLTMRYLAAEWEQNILINAWTETADVTWYKGFETPDLAAIFG